MTIEDRVVIDLADLAVVRFECSACGSAVSFKTADWTQIPAQCPGCRVTWLLPASAQATTLTKLANNLRGATAIAEAAGFRMCFELARQTEE